MKKLLSVFLLTMLVVTTISCTTDEDTFELVEWKVVCYSGQPSLQIIFSATGETSLHLHDPSGSQVDSDYIEGGAATASWLNMADYGKVPKAGRYKLIVENVSDEKLNTYSFDFDFQGADAAISDVVATWTYWSGSYTLVDISFKVTNSGDLPVNINEGSLTLDIWNDDLQFSDGCVSPNEQKTFSSSTSVRYITPGEKTLTLELRDRADKVVCSNSSTVTPSI